MNKKLIPSVLVAASIALVTACGGGGGSSGGGGSAGIGGTGISYGPVTGFGSVLVNGVEYDTSAADFSVEGSSTGIDQNDLEVGMVVTVTHDDNDNAKSVSYRDNAEGPVANLDAAGNSFDVLGLGITVDALTVYGGLTDVNADGAIDINDLANDDLVEVSGHIAGENAVLATRVEKTGACPLAANEEIEVKGTITSIVDANSFTLGALTVSYADGDAPDGLQAGDYVEVKSDACPVANAVTATEVGLEDEGPDLNDLDEGEDGMGINGVIANAAGSTPNCTFDINGQAVSTDSSTEIEGGADCDTLTDGAVVEVEGRLVAGVLVADQIGSEESDEDVDSELSGEVSVISQTSAFAGVISVNGSADITADINTVYDGESQDFNLDFIATSATPVCAEVEVDASMRAIGIHEKDCN
ncbi:MAG: hypothetical protein HY941_09045 [Gammaproteobacteria bacterium]|nr:hypothetical protein [Gammaproteobacteria bacterium]